MSFSRANRESKTKKLRLVHTDIYGPSMVTSLRGSNYYVTFNDDSSHKVWVYFLKNKSDVFNAFKRWKAMAENETGFKVKTLQSDNGGEHLDADFKRYYNDNSIKKKKTMPGNPQQIV